MTDSIQPGTTQTITRSTAAPDDTSSASGSLGEDFDSFLRLLTAQVQNQDPLSPLDSTQFVEQLASFSALEQQVQTNTYLKSIVDLVETLGFGTLGTETIDTDTQGAETQAPSPSRDTTG